MSLTRLAWGKWFSDGLAQSCSMQAMKGCQHGQGGIALMRWRLVLPVSTLSFHTQLEAPLSDAACIASPLREDGQE